MVLLRVTEDAATASEAALADHHPHTEAQRFRTWGKPAHVAVGAEVAMELSAALATSLQMPERVKIA
jgi:hypothetical protein